MPSHPCGHPESRHIKKSESKRQTDFDYLFCMDCNCVMAVPLEGF